MRRGDPATSRQREDKTRSSKLGRSILELKIGFAGTKRAPKSPRDHQEGAQDGSKTILRQSSAARIEKKRPKRDPREPKEQKDQSVSAHLGRSGGPKLLPSDPQEHPREAQEGPKTLSRPSPYRKPRFFKNRRMC